MHLYEALPKAQHINTTTYVHQAFQSPTLVKISPPFCEKSSPALVISKNELPILTKPHQFWYILHWYYKTRILRNIYVLHSNELERIKWLQWPFKLKMLKDTYMVIFEEVIDMNQTVSRPSIFLFLRNLGKKKCVWESVCERDVDCSTKK